MMNGPLDFMFDFNGNGELDPIEEAMLIDSLNDMQKNDSSKNAIEDAGYDPDNADFDFD